MHLYSIGAVAGTYLSWGMLFGVLSYFEILVSAGCIAGIMALSHRQRKFNKQDKVFAIVKKQSGDYSIGVLKGRELKPEYIDATKGDIKINEQWTEPQLGIKMRVKDRVLAIPADFKVDNRLWKELI